MVSKPFCRHLLPFLVAKCDTHHPPSTQFLFTFHPGRETRSAPFACIGFFIGAPHNAEFLFPSLRQGAREVPLRNNIVAARVEPFLGASPFMSKKTLFPIGGEFFLWSTFFELSHQKARGSLLSRERGRGVLSRRLLLLLSFVTIRPVVWRVPLAEAADGAAATDAKQPQPLSLSSRPSSTTSPTRCRRPPTTGIAG